MFDILEKIAFYRKRFGIPVFFLIMGIILLSMALTPSMEEIHTYQNGEIIATEIVEIPQNKGFFYGALFFLFASIIWVLYMFGVIKSFIGYAVVAVMAGLSAYILYTDYRVVQDQVAYDNDYEIRDLDIKARMGDIKAAELAFKEARGVYTNSMDELIEFVKTGKKMKILKKGKIPERKISVEERDYLYGDNRPIDKLMTEVEATALSKAPFPVEGLDPEFKRDTNFIDVMDAIFTDEKYVTNREKIGASLPFHPDSLRYVPHTKNLVVIDTGSVNKGELVAPTLYIEMTHPMPKAMGKDGSVIYSIGAVDDNHLRESWKDK